MADHVDDDAAVAVKLNLKIKDADGNHSTFSSFLYSNARVNKLNSRLPSGHSPTLSRALTVFFKVKSSTLFSKIFDAYAKQRSLDGSKLRFMFDGKMIKSDMRPSDVRKLGLR
jgi:hypothetical protein